MLVLGRVNGQPGFQQKGSIDFLGVLQTSDLFAVQEMLPL